MIRSGRISHALLASGLFVGSVFAAPMPGPPNLVNPAEWSGSAILQVGGDNSVSNTFLPQASPINQSYPLYFFDTNSSYFGDGTVTLKSGTTLRPSVSVSATLEGNDEGDFSAMNVLYYQAMIQPKAGVTATLNGSVGEMAPPTYTVSVSPGISVQVTISSLSYHWALMTSESGTNVLATEEADLIFPDYPDHDQRLVSPLLNVTQSVSNTDSIVGIGLNQPVSVGLYTKIFGGDSVVSGNFNGSVSAMSDPEFYLSDPLAAQYFDVVVSPNLTGDSTPTPSVPEPRSILLMGSSLLALASCLYRRTRESR